MQPEKKRTNNTPPQRVVKKIKREPARRSFQSSEKSGFVVNIRCIADMRWTIHFWKSIRLFRDRGFQRGWPGIVFASSLAFETPLPGMIINQVCFWFQKVKKPRLLYFCNAVANTSSGVLIGPHSILSPPTSSHRQHLTLHGGGGKAFIIGFTGKCIRLK